MLVAEDDELVSSLLVEVEVLLLLLSCVVVMMMDSEGDFVMEVRMGPSVPKAKGKFGAMVGSSHAAGVVESVVVVVDGSTEHPAVVWQSVCMIPSKRCHLE